MQQNQMNENSEPQANNPSKEFENPATENGNTEVPGIGDENETSSDDITMGNSNVEEEEAEDLENEEEESEDDLLDESDDLDETEETDESVEGDSDSEEVVNGNNNQVIN